MPIPKTTEESDGLALELWENELEDVNSVCYFPTSEISTILDIGQLGDELTPLKYTENISYHTAKYSISLRCLNNAFVWANVLAYLEFNGQTVCELCPGNNNVLDIALCLNRFEGQLNKVDYTVFADTGQSKIKRPFSTVHICIDIIEKVDEMPKSDLIVLNHAIDDLFIGLWAKDNDVDYFNKEMNDVDSNNQCWDRAIKNSDKYIEQLKEFAHKLTRRLNDGGFIVSSNYPSSYETKYRRINRVNFTKSLHEVISMAMSCENMIVVACDLDAIDGPKGSKYPESFLIHQKV